MLPLGNTSTLAFLAAFLTGSPVFGLAGAMIAGYAAAVTVLFFIKQNDRIRGRLAARSRRGRRDLAAHVVPVWLMIQAEGRQAAFTLSGPRPRSPHCLMHRRPRHRGRFAPRVEPLAW